MKGSSKKVVESASGVHLHQVESLMQYFFNIRFDIASRSRPTTESKPDKVIYSAQRWRKETAEAFFHQEEASAAVVVQDVCDEFAKTCCLF